MAKEASLVNVDMCGGIILGGGQTKAIFGTQPLAVVGDAITNHGLPPHGTAVITTGSSKMTIGGLAVARFGDAGSCGHFITTVNSTIWVLS